MRVSIDDSILNDIADSIREKTDTQDSFYPQDMASAIDSFAGITPTGTINITSNGTTDVTNYESANVDVLPTDYFNSTLQASGDSPLAKFIKVIPSNTTFSGTSAYRLFCDGATLTSLPLFDFSNVTTAENMCIRCTSLVTFPQYNFSSCSVFTNMCFSCTALENFPIINLQSARSLANMFSGCTSLTNDSLNNILASLLTATSYTGTKTLKYIGLTSAQATTCTSLSNWNDLSTAGWTKGY